MAAKFLVVLALVAAAHSSVVPATPLVQADNDYSSYSYDDSRYSYDVADPNTGDYKSQSEFRVGGTVRGQYSLLDADGTIRIVDYTADDVNGFNAVVRKEPATVTAKVVTPAIVSTPVVTPAYVARSIAVPSDYSVNTPSFYAASPSLYAPRTAAAPYYYSRTPYGYSSYEAPLAYW